MAKTRWDVFVLGLKPHIVNAGNHSVSTTHNINASAQQISLSMGMDRWRDRASPVPR